MPETLVELIARIKADATELEKGLTDAERKTEASSKKMSESLKKVGVAMAASGAAITAALGLMGRAAIDEEINIKRLATTINNSGTAYDNVKDSLEAVIAATQRKTGIADNEQRDILGRLVLITQDYNKALGLLPTVLDLAAAGEMDATTAATYLGKAYLELEQGAESVSVRFGQASLQFKNMEDIQNRVAGSAENLANPLSVLKASIGDVAEAIGTNLIPLIKDVVDKIVDITIKVQEWAKEHPELANQLTYLSLAIGAVFTAIGGLILILPSLISGYKSLIFVINTATASIWGFYASLIALPLAIIAASIAISELTGNTAEMNRRGQTLWYQNMGNWIMRQLGFAEAVKTTSEIISTLDGELSSLGLTGEELTKTYKTLSAAGYLSIGTSTIEQVRQYVKTIESLKEGTDDAAGALKNLDFATQAIKQSIAHATWQADGYTYSMQLFTQAEIDAAKASGKKVEELKSQSDITADNTKKVKNYTGAIDETVNSVDKLTKKYAELAVTATEALARTALSIQDFDKALSALSSEVTFEQGTPVLSLAASVAASRFGVEIPTAEQVASVKSEAHALGIPGYQQGGLVENTGLAFLHEGERVIPEGRGDGITINFTQPVFFDREDTMNRFVDMIRKGIQRQDRLRFGGAYNGK